MYKSGIYLIINLITNELYIGSSACGIKKRFTVHRHLLRTNKHTNLKLQNSWNKYKENAFIFSSLEYVEPKNCIEREQFWMNLLRPEFNLLPFARNRLGSKHTDKTKKKLSKIHKGLNTWSKGKILSAETKNKIRIANIGKKVSLNTRKKISKVRTGSGNGNSKSIKCIELNKIFDSIRLATKFIRNTSNPKAGHSPISHCARGNKKYSHAYGFSWKYINV